MAQEIRVGDKVKISKKSEYYNDESVVCGNPKCKGVVTKIEDIPEDCLPVYVDWENGDSNSYSTTDLIKVKIKKMSNQSTKDLVLKVVKKLLRANNTVTTLEVKVELRKTDPATTWNQQTISQLMDELHQEGHLTFTDNGTYRIYSLTNKTSTKVNPTVTSIAATTTTATKRVSVKKALELMAHNKGHFFTATFVKKDGVERTINCQYLKGQDELNQGYVKVKEAVKLKTNPTDCIRQINLQTLKSLKIGGELLKIRRDY